MSYALFIYLYINYLWFEALPLLESQIAKYSIKKKHKMHFIGKKLLFKDFLTVFLSIFKNENQAQHGQVFNHPRVVLNAHAFFQDLLLCKSERKVEI